MRRRVAGGGVVFLLLLAPLAGCGGGEGGAGDRPTLSPTVSPTRTLPSPTRTPTRTLDPTSEPTDEPTDEPTVEPTNEPTSEPTEAPPTTEVPATSSDPSEPPTQDTTQRPRPTQQESATPSASPSETAAAAEEEQDPGEDAVPTWVWWLIGVLVVAAAALTWALVARSRSRKAWREQLAAAEDDVAWLARELLPQLRAAGSLERVAGGWQVAQPRVAATEDRLTVLESSAKDEADGVRARSLRDALRAARARVEGLDVAGEHDTWALDLDEAIALLESALAAGPQRVA